jgi:hypothetical protein
MRPSSRPSSSSGAGAPRSLLVGTAAALVLAVAVAACGVTGAANPSGTPVASPVASPSAPAEPSAQPAPTPVPTPVVTPQPTLPLVTPGPGGVDGSRIPLRVFGDNVVTLDIADPEHLLADAASGDAQDGMSVRWGDVLVRNLDPKTVEVTWVGLPGDEAATLVVKRDGDGVIVRFGQRTPPVDSDAMGADRVVVLTFAEPVAAADVATDVTSTDD